MLCIVCMFAMLNVDAIGDICWRHSFSSVGLVIALCVASFALFEHYIVLGTLAVMFVVYKCRSIILESVRKINDIEI